MASRLRADGGREAVEWLPLEAAFERLSRVCERAFLANVGPLALEAAALDRLTRRPKARKQPVLEKRRRRQAVAPPPSVAMPISAAPQPELISPAIEPDEPPFVGSDLVEAGTSVRSLELGKAPPFAQEISAMAAVEPQPGNQAAAATDRCRRINLAQKVWDRLRRAA